MHCAYCTNIYKIATNEKFLPKSAKNALDLQKNLC